MDFSKITARIFTGAAISSNDDVKELIAAGVTHVIDCRVEFNDGELFAHQPTITYLYNGTADDGQPKPTEWFQRSLEFALPALGVPNTKVYAHCAAGVNRGPSTAFSIMLAQGFSFDDAEKIMREKRPQVGIAYKFDAFSAVKRLGYI